LYREAIDPVMLGATFVEGLGVIERRPAAAHNPSLVGESISP
jgi:hypothetical protein